jgi:hypothetical protein
MRGPLAQQAQENLGKSALVMNTERVDEVALLIGQMVKRALWRYSIALSPGTGSNGGSARAGWRCCGWCLSSSKGTTGRCRGEASIKGGQHPLSLLSGQVIDALDDSDDRLGHWLDEW